MTNEERFNSDFFKIPKVRIGDDFLLHQKEIIEIDKKFWKINIGIFIMAKKHKFGFFRV
jgi:hypothetical protein